MIGTFRALLAIAGCLAMSAAMADDTENAGQCADIDNDVLRLECFDQAVRGDGSDTEPRTDGNTPGTQHAEAAEPIHEEHAVQPSEPPSTAEDRFGLDVETEPGPGEDEPDQIAARISGIELRRFGRRVFTLDNGQIWAEESENRGVWLKVGDSVTIKSGLFGSYRLFGSGNRSSRVERIR